MSSLELLRRKLAARWGCSWRLVRVRVEVDRPGARTRAGVAVRRVASLWWCRPGRRWEFVRCQYGARRVLSEAAERLGWVQ